MIRAATVADAESIAGIYNYYITETVISFEEKALAAAAMARRIADIGAASLPWLVAERDTRVVGYAYAGRWHGRCAYRFSTEITVYVDRTHVGRGIGSQLYGELFPLLRGRGIHAAIGGIALPNPASVALHEKFGMQKAAHFREVGFKFDRWIDVGYWHRTL